MIVVYTKYDAATAVLNDCAIEFVRQAGTLAPRVLGPSKSSAQRVQQSLGQLQKIAFFFFGHGKLGRMALFAQDQKPAVDATNLSLLQDRLVCATCCHSAEILANAVVSHGSTLLGYSGPLVIPLPTQYHNAFRHSVLAGPLKLVAGASAADAAMATTEEFNLQADTLIRGPVPDRVMASYVFRKNALAVRLAGPDRIV
jgi:hypothetical protein